MTDLAALAESWELSLVAQRKSPQTIASYLTALSQFEAYCHDNDLPTTVTDVRREHIEKWIASLLERLSPNTAGVRCRSLQQFWRWTLQDEIVAVSPMASARPPQAQQRPGRVLSEGEVTALRRTCGKARGEFRSVRDDALVVISSRASWQEGLHCRVRVVAVKQAG